MISNLAERAFGSSAGETWTSAHCREKGLIGVVSGAKTTFRGGRQAELAS